MWVMIIFCILPFAGFFLELRSPVTPSIDSEHQVSAPLMKLSEYGFFDGKIAEQKPSGGVIPYTLNTPLFSDYAEKLRFIKIPSGMKAEFNDTAVFDFPVGTIIIKTFYFPNDFRNLLKGRRLIETRLLIHEEKGWKALPYIWNEDQTDATLDVAGETTTVSYVDLKGKKQIQNYIIPNMNQCKGCHNKGEILMPIGPTAWQLNGDYNYSTEKENQLIHWTRSGILASYDSLKGAPKGVVWNDPGTGTISERARIWLDINCAHCHRGDGPASSSGLQLGWQEKDPVKIGIDKTPVAAGRGSGGLKFDIVPGKPDESIFIFRLKSTDPGIMMPELGRTMIQPESIQLVSDWIRELGHQR